ncbi:hypothetical protein TIFTF001_037752 [Ficus carica]|uniref:Uncharacterized protein n=1 Tax=Ficus carica TaxID=3494 RepID=A0AA88E5X6_FICCA|nr:hypothetical protein TIFTF001_037561 [Ficus carica]GMN68697.1 hypothetical protein TIFTF001_037752 [Ficus carica]
MWVAGVGGWSPAVERSPATEKTLGGKYYMRLMPISPFGAHGIDGKRWNLDTWCVGVCWSTQAHGRMVRREALDPTRPHGADMLAKRRMARRVEGTC